MDNQEGIFWEKNFEKLYDGNYLIIEKCNGKESMLT